jgi:hypothetical protein
MNEEQKAELDVLAGELYTAKRRYELLGMVNISGKTHEELKKQSIEYQLARLEVARAEERLSKFSRIMESEEINSPVYLFMHHDGEVTQGNSPSDCDAGSWPVVIRVEHGKSGLVAKRLHLGDEHTKKQKKPGLSPC